jgi:hypothetical protein
MLTLVETSLLRGSQVLDIPDVGDGVAILGGTVAAELVELVVHNEVLLPLGVEDPALVGVGGALVRGDGDDGRVGGVGRIVDGEGVLVVTVADVTAGEAGVGALAGGQLASD